MGKFTVVASIGACCALLVLLGNTCDNLPQAERYAVLPTVKLLSLRDNQNSHRDLRGALRIEIIFDPTRIFDYVVRIVDHAKNIATARMAFVLRNINEQLFAKVLGR